MICSRTASVAAKGGPPSQLVGTASISGPSDEAGFSVPFSRCSGVNGLALDLRIGEARRVAAGKHAFVAVLVGRLDGDGDLIEGAARRTFLADAAGRHVDALGVGIALDEFVELLAGFWSPK